MTLLIVHDVGRDLAIVVLLRCHVLSYEALLQQKVEVLGFESVVELVLDDDAVQVLRGCSIAIIAYAYLSVFVCQDVAVGAAIRVA